MVYYKIPRLKSPVLDNYFITSLYISIRYQDVFDANPKLCTFGIDDFVKVMISLTRYLKRYPYSTNIVLAHY